jgi:glyoxylase-like metal-dependent hydrolase (beta-lactamase superfamily II)
MSHVQPVRVGRIEIRTICEGWAGLALADEAPGRTVDWDGERERRPWAFVGTDRWRWHVHAFVVRLPSGMTILVDTGVGDFPPYAPWEESVEDPWQEVETADVRHVMVTHLHADHAGGTVIGGAPAFPNSTVHVHEADWSAFAGSTDADDYVARHAMSSLLELGMLSITDTDREPVPGVYLRHTPGHTPGHRSVIIADGEEAVLFTGDLLHLPTQAAHPGWWSSHDEDPQLGAASRRLVLWRAAQDGWRVGVPHFARPFGSVGSKGWLE